MKLQKLLALSLVSAMVVTGCGSKPEIGSPSENIAPPGTTDAANNNHDSNPTTITPLDVELSIGEWDNGSKFEDMTECAITLSDSGSSVSGSGATADGSSVTITEEGVYRVKGSLSAGSIGINAASAHVKLILDGVDITNASTSPITVYDAKKVVLWLADGSANTLTYKGDGSVSEDEEVSGAAGIFSKDDFTINGAGSLTINSGANGISGKEQVKIVNGTLSVTSDNNGIRGKDCIEIYGGSITVNAGNDGIKSRTSDENTAGYVAIVNGSLNITSVGDAIDGESLVYVQNGTIHAVTGGGADASTKEHHDSFGPAPKASDDSDSVSTKGLKSSTSIIIDGGTISLDCADDTIHSKEAFALNGGVLTLRSGDDAIHAGTDLTIKGGYYDIAQCYEGIEAASITISGGEGSLTSTDDGLNANSEDDSWGGPAVPSSGTLLTISGGKLYINAGGDGVDSNGSIVMSGGLVVVDGPTNDGNGPIDYGAEFTMTGGTIVAVGSSGMAESVTADGCNAVQVFYTEKQSAGDTISITDASGKNVLTFAPKKDYSNLVFCSPLLSSGEYTLQTGGNASGTPWNGLFSEGTVTDAKALCTFTVSEANTCIQSDGSAYSPEKRFGPGGNDRGPKDKHEDFPGDNKPKR